MISTDRARELLQTKRDQIDSLKSKGMSSPEYEKWRRDTAVIIEKIFDSTHKDDFTHALYSRVISSARRRSSLPRRNYYSSSSSNLSYSSDLNLTFQKNLESAKAILDSMIEELEVFGSASIHMAPLLDSSHEVKSICDRFHLIARQLRDRYSNRSTLDINDEYDVQDLLHSLLHLKFEDIRPEPWTPSYAGGHSRCDFLLKNERIFIEVKKTRVSMSERDIGDQLIIDIKRYQTHPDCEKLICFVYDPEGRIGNPRGLETDLTGLHDSLEVEVIVRPK